MNVFSSLGAVFVVEDILFGLTSDVMDGGSDAWAGEYLWRLGLSTHVPTRSILTQNSLTVRETQRSQGLLVLFFFGSC